MMRKNLFTPKNTLIILSLLAISAAVFVTLGQVQKKQLIGSEAQLTGGLIQFVKGLAQPTCTVISSMDTISSKAGNLRRGATFCVKVSKSLYQTAMVTAARLYIKQTGNKVIGEPIDTNLVSYNNIKGTFSYGSPGERKYVEFYYYYYVNTTYGRVQIRVTSGKIGGRTMSAAEKGTIEVEANKMAVYLWGVYSRLVAPTDIYNDANYVSVTFRVL